MWLGFPNSWTTFHSHSRSYHLALYLHDTPNPTLGVHSAPAQLGQALDPTPRGSPLSRLLQTPVFCPSQGGKPWLINKWMFFCICVGCAALEARCYCCPCALGEHPCSGVAGWELPGFLPQRIPLGPLLALHFCLLEAARPCGHCVGRLKGFGGNEGAETPAAWLRSVSTEGLWQKEGSEQSLPLR